VRKKISAAAGLVTVATAGALFASTPAYAMEDSVTITPEVSSSAPATAGQQTSVSTSPRTVADDGWRRRHRYRHRRYHRRYHRRHFRHHRHHFRHHRYWY
jgi:hypothetical protein